MSKEVDDNLRDAYDAFWRKRDEVKKRQRRELEEQTAGERQALARAIWDARRAPSKYTVRDIADLLGLTNRNFIYTVLRDEPLNDPDAATNAVGRPSAAQRQQAKADKEKSTPFHLSHSEVQREDDMVYVSVSDARTSAVHEYNIYVDGDGRIVEIPEAWYSDELDPAEVQFYKDLIQTIESA